LANIHKIVSEGNSLPELKNVVEKSKTDFQNFGSNTETVISERYEKVGEVAKKVNESLGASVIDLTKVTHVFFF